MLKCPNDVINNILLKIGASKDVIDYYCKDNKKIDDSVSKTLTKGSSVKLANKDSVKLVSSSSNSFKDSVKAPKPSKESSSSLKPSKPLKVTPNDLEKRLVALILKKKSHSCGEPNTISIATVYRVLEMSFKELRRKIPDFDEKFSTSGTGAGRHIRMIN
jgi:hypothetical protein